MRAVMVAMVMAFYVGCAGNALEATQGAQEAVFNDQYEPNDDPMTAFSVVSPVDISGSFVNDKDVDCYRLPTGSSMVIVNGSMQSRRVGDVVCLTGVGNYQVSIR